MKMTQCPGCGARMPVLMSYCTKCGEPIAARTMKKPPPLPGVGSVLKVSREIPCSSSHRALPLLLTICAMLFAYLVIDAPNGGRGTIFAGGLMTVAGVFIYFLPSFIADKRNHHNKSPIFLINLLLGWSFLGWLAALVWSVSAVKPNNNGVLTSD